MNYTEMYENLTKGIFMICEALVAITETECCNYGFDVAVKMAEEYIKAYEEEHPDGKKA